MIKKLKQNQLHDKIEFKLIKTCNSIDLESYFSKFLNKNESKIYKKNLINLTNKIIDTNSNKFFEADIQKIYYLKKNCSNFLI